MTLEEIRNEVIGVIPNTGLSSDDIDVRINQTYARAAGEVTIPDLKTIGSIVTVISVAHVSLVTLPNGFSGRLRKVMNVSGDEMLIYPTLDLLLSAYPTMVEAGDVEAVALEGRVLWYQKIPAVAETLSLLYTMNPPPLVSDSDEPEYLPEHVHWPILIGGTCERIWDGIEDGIDGVKVNTVSHSNTYKVGIMMLREHIAMTTRHYISSRWNV